jgi:hypothetical protein
MKRSYINLLSVFILLAIWIFPSFIPIIYYDLAQPIVLICVVVLYLTLWFLPRFSFDKKRSLFLKAIKTFALIGLFIQLWLWGILGIISTLFNLK